MARFIVIEVERPDPDDTDGSMAMLSDKYYFSPLKVKWLKKYEDALIGISKRERENEKKLAEDPDFAAKPFEGLKDIGNLLFDLIKIKHKKMTKEEFEDIFSIVDYHDIMAKLTPSDLT